MLPRNFKVKWIFSGGTQRINAPIVFRKSAVSLWMICWSSSGISRAMNVRRRLMRSGCCGLTAKCTVHSFLQIYEADRLCQVCGRARLHTMPDIGGHTHGGNNNDRDIQKQRVCAHLAQNIETGNLRHHYIEQDNIWLFVSHHCDGWSGAGSLDYMESTDAHHLREQFSGILFVFDDQDGFFV